MATLKLSQEVLADKEFESILSGLLYLKNEAQKEGLSEVSTLLIDLIVNLKNHQKNSAVSLKKFSGEGDCNHAKLDQVIQLLSKLSDLEKNQIEALNKLISMI